MRNNNFLKTLSNISPKDFKSFCKYSFGLYQTQSAANQILGYLKRFHPDFDRHELDERLAYLKIFKGEKFNKPKLTNAISDLRRLLKEFLLWQYITHKKLTFEKEYLLLKILEKQRLDSLTRKQFKKIELLQKENSKLNTWFWMNNLRFEHERYFNPFLEKVGHQSAKIDEAMKSLDCFLGITKLKYSCELLARNQIIKDPQNPIKYLEEVLNQDWAEVSFLHNCYHKALLLIKNRTDVDYQNFKQLIFQNFKNLRQEDQHILLTYLINHAAFRIRQGIHEFAYEIFELYKIGVKYEAFIIAGSFNEDHFGNIVDVGCRLGHYEWSEQFVNKWGDFLESSYKNEIITFSKALILHGKKDYDKAISLLQNDFKKNMFYALKAKWLEIVCFYEKGEDVGFIIDRCNAFKQFLRRNNLIHEHLRKGALNFVRFFLMFLNPDLDKYDLLKKLESAEFIIYKSWLVNELANLK